MDLTLEQITRKSEEQIRKTHYKEMLLKPYEEKVNHSKALVHEFVNILGLDNVYVSTSGGKDSACLSRLCKNIYPDVKHIMFNTGLEYQVTIDLAKQQGAEIIPPKVSWVKFCEEQGYPVGGKGISRRIHDANNTLLGCAISLFSKNYGLPNIWLHFLNPNFVDFPISNKCCDEFKKKPSHLLNKVNLNPIIGTRISESRERSSAWKKSGCNSYSLDYKHGVSKPISLWCDDDVEQYIQDENVGLSMLYTQYEQKRTGCVNCPYGAHIVKQGEVDESRFEVLKKLEPKRYEYFMHTKLRRILAMSNVPIPSDTEYTKYKDRWQEVIEKWRKRNKGNDNYLTFKCRYALQYFSKDEMKKAVIHISRNELKYDLSIILSCFDRLEIKQ